MEAVEVKTHILLTLALGEGGCSDALPNSISPSPYPALERATCTLWIRKLGRPQSWSGCGGEEVLPCRESKCGIPAMHHVSCSLYLLSYLVCHVDLTSCSRGSISGCCEWLRHISTDITVGGDTSNVAGKIWGRRQEPR